MSQRNQHLTYAMLRKPATTTPKQFQQHSALAKIGNIQAGLETLFSNCVPRNPAIPLRLQKHCIGFLTRRSGPSQCEVIAKSKARALVWVLNLSWSSVV